MDRETHKRNCVTLTHYQYTQMALGNEMANEDTAARFFVKDLTPENEAITDARYELAVAILRGEIPFETPDPVDTNIALGNNFYFENGADQDTVFALSDWYTEAYRGKRF